MTNAPTTPNDAEIRQIALRLDRPVVLVGMMGTGKSTVGRRLATLLDLPFADADDEIEQAAQMSVSEIFETFDEDYFRAGERRVMARLLDGGPCVIATGGGAFVQPETRALILERGIAVWLDSDVDTLVERTSRKDSRPLLKGGNPREIITDLKERRAPAYAEAPIHITSDRGPHGEAAMRIIEALREWQ